LAVCTVGVVGPLVVGLVPIVAVGIVVSCSNEVVGVKV
jgi:hypothetical protein